MKCHSVTLRWGCKVDCNYVNNYVILLNCYCKQTEYNASLAYYCVTLKAWSHECHISLRMTNECNLWASVDICRKCVSCSFDPMTGRSSLGNLRCLCVLFSFVNVIRFSCVKRYSFLTPWPMRHSSFDRALNLSYPLGGYSPWGPLERLELRMHKETRNG